MIILYKRPPRVAFIWLFLAFQVHLRVPEPVIIPTPENLYLFAIITAAGAILVLMSLFSLKQKGTTHKFEEIPTEESIPTALVTEGIYAYSRNPTYVGITVILFGIAALFATPWVFLAPLAFLLTANYFFIPKEELLLEVLFEDEYLSYQTRVRKWF